MTPPSATLLDRARAWAAIATHAPSGDNSQPWLVGLSTERDAVVLRLEIDDANRAAPSVFDCRLVASYLSLGTFAGNFAQLAAAEGFVLADLQETGGRIQLTFTRDAHVPSDSATTEAVIRRRTTNRLPFKKDPLDATTRRDLQETVRNDGLDLREFTGKEKNALAGAFTGLDRIRYRNAALYYEFLDKLRFGGEGEQSRDGLRDTTLGVPAPSLLFLRLLRALRSWRFIRAIFYIGFERVMAFFGCRMLIGSAPSVFALSGGEDTPLDWFRLGMGFEHFWLATTAADLAMQPLGTTLLIYRLRSEERAGRVTSFSSAEQARLREIGEQMRKDFGFDLDRPLIACRVGRGPRITNTSLRREVRFRD